MGDVVAIADIRDRDAVKVGPFALADREDVGETLARMGEIGEAVDHRHRAVPRELLDRFVRVHPQHYRIGHSARDASDVRDALAAAEADLGRRQIDTVAAELRDADVERKACAQARLFEDEGDRAAGQPAARRSSLESRGLVEQPGELVALQIGDG